MRSLILFIIGFVFAAHQGFAQNRIIEKTFEADEEQKVRLDLKFGNQIVVKAWDREDISFRAEIEINSGNLNEALLLDFKEEQNYLLVQSNLDEKQVKRGRIEDCPNRGYTTHHWNNGDDYAVCYKIKYVVYVPKQVELDIETISADIEMADLAGPIDARSISGFVDLAWPGQYGADISVKTISGEAFSDLDNLDFPHKKAWPIVGYELNGKIGSGGPRVRLESISGNIYLRKTRES